MLEEELECIDALNSDNVNNMAQLENILEFHNISMSKDDNKYIMEEYSACDKVSKDNLAWYKHNKEFISKMRAWLSSYETDKKYIESTIQDIQKILNTT